MCERLTCTAAWSLAAMMRLVAEHLRGVYSSPLFSTVDDDMAARGRKRQRQRKGEETREAAGLAALVRRQQRANTTLCNDRADEQTAQGHEGERRGEERTEVN